MNKKLVIVLVAILFTASFGISASAETSATSDRQVTSTEELMKMIARLQAQIKTLSGQNSGNSVVGGTEEKFEFKQELRKGVQGDDVTKLQRVLASDKAIYPEGLTTGFFGDRTGEALKKFQAKFGLEVTGEFDPKTRELVNKILRSQGAKNEIPMGLLVTPGLRERVKVRLENSNGKFEYKIDVDDSDSNDDGDDLADDNSSDDVDGNDDSDSRLKIEVEDKSDDKSKVKVELRNGFSEAKRVFLLDTRDHDEIISIVAERIGVTKTEVSSVIKFESDDDDDSSDDSNDDSNHGSDDSDDDDSNDDSNDDN